MYSCIFIIIFLWNEYEFGPFFLINKVLYVIRFQFVIFGSYLEHTHFNSNNNNNNNKSINNYNDVYNVDYCHYRNISMQKDKTIKKHKRRFNEINIFVPLKCYILVPIDTHTHKYKHSYILNSKRDIKM